MSLSETMTKIRAFRSLISQRVSKPPSAYERVRQWVCGLGGWPPQPRSGAEGFAGRVCMTRRWRKTDSNSRSLREGKGYGEPLQASIAVSGLNL
jgi:hypothetical protein